MVKIGKVLFTLLLFSSLLSPYPITQKIPCRSKKFSDYSYAVFLYEIGEINKAISLLKQYKNDPEILILLAKFTLNDPYRALEYLNDAQKILKSPTPELLLLKMKALYLLYLKENSKSHLDEAEKILDSISNYYEDSLEFNYTAGEIKKYLKKYESAIVYFEKALFLSNTPLSIYRILLPLYAVSKNYKKFTSTLLKLISNDAISLNELSYIVDNISQDVDDFDDESFRNLKELSMLVLKKWQYKKEPLKIAIKLLFYCGEFDEISKIYENYKDKIFSYFKDSQPLLIIIGISLEQTSRFDEFSKLYLKLKSQPPYLKLIMAKNALKRGYYKTSKKIFDEIDDEFIERSSLWKTLYYSSLINYYLKTKNKSQLKETLSRIENSKKIKDSLPFELFKAYLFVNEADKAIETIGKNKELKDFILLLLKNDYRNTLPLFKKDNLILFLQYSEALFQIKNYDYTAFLETIKEKLPKSHYYYLKGSLELKSGNQKKAIRYFKKAFSLKKIPFYLNSYLYVSLLYGEIPRIKEEDLFLLLEGENPSYLDTYGYYLLKKKKFKSSLPYLFKAYYLMPYSGEIISHIAEAYYYLENYNTSSYYFKRAIEMEFIDEVEHKKFLLKYEKIKRKISDYREFFNNGVLLFSIKERKPVKNSFRISVRFYKNNPFKISIYGGFMKKVSEIYIESSPEDTFIVNLKTKKLFKGDFEEIVKKTLGIKISYDDFKKLVKGEENFEKKDCEIIIKSFKKGFPAYSLVKFKDNSTEFMFRIKLLKSKKLNSKPKLPSYKNFDKVYSLEQIFHEK